MSLLDYERKPPPKRAFVIVIESLVFTAILGLLFLILRPTQDHSSLGRHKRPTTQTNH